MKNAFLLDPSVVYLNHGSYGATPRPVFERYQALQLELEREPVVFIQERLPALLGEARQALGSFLNAGSDDLGFVTNPTFAVNQVARSLELGPDDEVLTIDHEYGACDRCWSFLSARRGFEVRRQHIPLPLESPEDVADRIWAGVTSATRLLFISHITSATAMRMPVEILCRRARDAGIITLVDGAHAPSQIDLDLTALDADFYTGACHKWLCAPKGASFLYAHPRVQPLVEPWVVSWGYGPEPKPDFGSTFLNYTSWLGTRDMSAILAVPAAIRFQAEHDWKRLRGACHQLASAGESSLRERLAMPSAYGQRAAAFSQMAVCELPAGTDGPALRETLYRSHRVQIPVMAWHSRQFLRLSIQVYNDASDLEALLSGLETALASGLR